MAVRTITTIHTQKKQYLQLKQQTNVGISITAATIPTLSESSGVLRSTFHGMKINKNLDEDIMKSTFRVKCHCLFCMLPTENNVDKHFDVIHIKLNPDLKDYYVYITIVRLASCRIQKQKLDSAKLKYR